MNKRASAAGWMNAKLLVAGFAVLDATDSSLRLWGTNRIALPATSPREQRAQLHVQSAENF